MLLLGRLGLKIRVMFCNKYLPLTNKKMKMSVLRCLHLHVSYAEAFVSPVILTDHLSQLLLQSLIFEKQLILSANPISHGFKNLSEPLHPIISHHFIQHSHSSGPCLFTAPNNPPAKAPGSVGAGAQWLLSEQCRQAAEMNASTSVGDFLSR